MAMSPYGEQNRSISLDSAANDFLKVAKVFAASRGEAGQAQRLAAEVPSARVRDTIELLEQYPIKSAVGVMGLSETLAPYRQLSDGFFASMAEFSAFARIYAANDFYKVPLRTTIPVSTLPFVGDSVL